MEYLYVLALTATLLALAYFFDSWRGFLKLALAAILLGVAFSATVAYGAYMIHHIATMICLWIIVLLCAVILHHRYRKFDSTILFCCAVFATLCMPLLVGIFTVGLLYGSTDKILALGLD